MVGRVATKFTVQVSDLADFVQRRNWKCPHEDPLKRVAAAGCRWIFAESSR
jgi:hypothetical protein